MIEVKVPADINSYKKPLLKGATAKEVAYIGIMAAIVVPIAVFGDRIMHPELVGWLCMILGGLILSPLFLEKSGKHGVTGEEYLINMVRFLINCQKRPYDFVDSYAREAMELERQRQEEARKRKKLRKRRRSRTNV